jgi:hypothetical protein
MIIEDFSSNSTPKRPQVLSAEFSRNITVREGILESPATETKALDRTISVVVSIEIILKQNEANANVPDSSRGARVLNSMGIHEIDDSVVL